MNTIETLVKIKEFFNTDLTKSYEFRLEQLKNLKATILNYRNEIVKALYDDLHKCRYETYTTEIAPVLAELDFAIENLKDWMREVEITSTEPETKTLVLSEPFGVILNIVPFNYPFQLAIVPLIGMIASGNCAAIRLSKRTPKTEAVLEKIIADAFESNYVKIFNSKEVSSNELLEFDFDYIFFTGSAETAKIVAQSASKRLIPYTLELGGKSPTIIDETSDLKISAQRIIRGKLLNMGQTCVAPDYLLVKREIKYGLIEELISAIKKFYGFDPQYSSDLGRIIDTEAFRRIKSLIESEAKNIVYGGKTDECGLYIEPTIIDNVEFTSEIMAQETFSPILPIITYRNKMELIEKLKTKAKPLALYIFSKDEDFIKSIVSSLSFGGGAINDVMKQIINPKAPFGGVGLSGIGQYHGKYSFDTFSHKKTMFINKNLENDLNFYPPYTDEKLRLIKEKVDF